MLKSYYYVSRKDSKPIAARLTQDDYAVLEYISAKMGIKKSQLVARILRSYIVGYRKGRNKLPPPNEIETKPQ